MIRLRWLLGIMGLTVPAVLFAQTGTQAPARSCADVLAQLNIGLQTRSADALLAAASLHESGRCVAQSDARAAEYLNEAARGGNKFAVVRLARKFGRGWGVSQSYATAGAWMTGKGATDERIEPWDYSVGYASTLLNELLAAVSYPVLESPAPFEISFAVEIDALRPTRLTYRLITPPSEAVVALSGNVERNLQRKLTEVLGWLAPTDARWIVSARVTIPVTLHYDSATAVSAKESDRILR